MTVALIEACSWLFFSATLASCAVLSVERTSSRESGCCRACWAPRWAVGGPLIGVGICVAAAGYHAESLRLQPGCFAQQAGLAGVVGCEPERVATARLNADTRLTQGAGLERESSGPLLTPADPLEWDGSRRLQCSTAAVSYAVRVEESGLVGWVPEERVVLELGRGIPPTSELAMLFAVSVVVLAFSFWSLQSERFFKWEIPFLSRVLPVLFWMVGVSFVLVLLQGFWLRPGAISAGRYDLPRWPQDHLSAVDDRSEAVMTGLYISSPTHLHRSPSSESPGAEEPGGRQLCQPRWPADRGDGAGSC